VRKLKILYFCNAVNRKNGWCVINYYCCREAVESGHEVLALTSVDAANDPIEGVKFYPILFPVGGLRQNILLGFRSFFQVGQVIKKENPDLVHVLVEPYLLYLGLIRAKRLVLTIVGTFAVSIFKDSGIKFFYWRALSRVKKIISISDYTADVFRKSVSSKNEIVTVPLGVDFEAFRKREESKQREILFCFVGHIKPRKGLIFLLEAMAKIGKQYPEAKLSIVGSFEDESYADRCKKLVAEKGLSDNVKFLGRLSQEDVCALYGRSILNLLPSYGTTSGAFEGFGLIHLEANAAGTLTLGCLDSGNESAIVDGRSGFLVRQESVDDIVEKMKEVIEIYKTGNYDRYSEQCIQYAKSNSWQKYFEKLELQYEKLFQ
jgi:glycosyltransferase involved in cell wall biosynthesis